MLELLGFAGLSVEEAACSVAGGYSHVFEIGWFWPDPSPLCRGIRPGLSLGRPRGRSRPVIAVLGLASLVVAAAVPLFSQSDQTTDSDPGAISLYRCDGALDVEVRLDPPYLLLTPAVQLADAELEAVSNGRRYKSEPARILGSATTEVELFELKSDSNGERLEVAPSVVRLRGTVSGQPESCECFLEAQGLD
jgi:hypothetical protein